MKIGFVGLGKMGYQIVVKLLQAGIEVVALDVNQDAVQRVAKEGAIAATSREDLVEKLGENPMVWLMIPSNFVNDEIAAYTEILPKGAVLIDGGNTNYEDTLKHGELLSKKGIELVDIGTSGGVMGLENGFSLMIGGTYENYERLQPALDALALPDGIYGYMGPTGYGHYVKMVHNGIEYGVMQALAEGYHLLKEGPLTDIPLEAVAEVWQHGSIIESTLNKLVLEILQENPSLEGIDGYVADSGEGRWTLEAAHARNIKMPVLRDSLKVRFDSQHGDVSYTTQLLAAMRNKFGGHAINKQESN
ncbi:MAG: decarboxylating 6-phosphogluconate dehydrogenase [Candidatus Saccharimonadales bacterium]